MNIQIELRLPSAEDFQKLRADVSWGPLSLDQASKALSGSVGGVIVLIDGKVIGMARLVGDGILNIYIQDVIIMQVYRKRGIGQALMTALVKHITEIYPKDCLIGLFAADNQDGFYTRFGFSPRPNVGFGPGMHATVSDLAKSSGAA